MRVDPDRPVFAANEVPLAAPMPAHSPAHSLHENPFEVETTRVSSDTDTGRVVESQGSRGSLALFRVAAHGPEQGVHLRVQFVRLRAVRPNPVQVGQAGLDQAQPVEQAGTLDLGAVAGRARGALAGLLEAHRDIG